MSKIARIILIAGLLASHLLLPARPTFACSCMAPAPPGEALEQADAVFAGRITEGPQRGGSMDGVAGVAYRFEVSEVWKGDAPSDTWVQTAPDSAACGYNFEADREYLVYATAQGGEFHTNLCTRTALLGDAVEDLDTLGDGTAPVRVAQETSDTDGVSGFTLWAWGTAAVLLILAIGGSLLARQRGRAG